MSVKNEKFDGSVIIGRDLTLGGGVITKGSSTFEKNLRVEGWLDAPNLRGACKGLFATEEKLNDMYPNPEDGMWAMVGEAIPAYVYMAENGEWVDTGNLTDGINVNIHDSDIVINIDELREYIENVEGALEAEASTRESNDDKLNRNITNISRNLVEEGNLRASADEEIRNRFKKIFLPFEEVVNIEQSKIQSMGTALSGTIVFNQATKTFIYKAKSATSVNYTYYNTGAELETGEYGTVNTSYGYTPFEDKMYNTTNAIYQWNGTEMKIVNESPTKTSQLINDSGFITSASTSSTEIALIEISGSMSTNTFAFTASEWQSILDAYNANKVIVLKDKGYDTWASGWFMPNIKIVVRTTTCSMYMSYYIGTKYGQITSTYNVATGVVSSTSVTIASVVNFNEPISE